MANNKKFWKYFKEYQWSNVYAMIKNNRKDPKICTEDFIGKLVVITGATSGIGKVSARKKMDLVGIKKIIIVRNHVLNSCDHSHIF